MITSIFFALFACALWGMVFVIPRLLEGFHPFEIAIGRCLAFGLFSLCIFIRKRKQMLKYLSKELWLAALHLSFTANILHYISLVISLTYGNPMLTTLILGTNPVTIAWYGNFNQKKQRPMLLLIPSLLILTGLLAINFPLFQNGILLSNQLQGISFALVALATWTWFIVANADFLKNNVKVPVHDWVTVIGIATLFWASLCTFFAFIFHLLSKQNVSFAMRDSLTLYLICSLALGVGSTWCAQYFWNHATKRLSIAMSGQLIVFETIFGLLFTYILEGRLATLPEFLGIIIIFIGITIAVSHHAQNPLTSNE